MNVKLFLILLALFVFASPIFAAPAKGTPEANYHWVAVTAGFSMAIASGLCGLAQAKAVAAADEGMGRHPGASAAIRLAIILGLVFIEYLSLKSLDVITF